MQKRKPEIESLILENAESEFYTFGYEQASLRRIIKVSGISIGNFYNYFESKEDLFGKLVEEEYAGFIRLIGTHETMPNPLADIHNLNNMQLKDVFLPLIQQVLPDFNRRFVILIEGSKGSQYEHARTQLLNLLKEHLHEHANEMQATISESLATLLADQFISGVIQIIRQNENEPLLRNETMSEFILFFFIGVMGLLGVKL